MVIVDVSSVKCCAKRGCHTQAQDRHHRGCEGMWLRHFKHKSRSKKWQAFQRRYYQFLPADCTDLCRAHHREIHRIYYLLIGGVARNAGPCKSWTWVEAEKLMAMLRTTCTEWLDTPTKGVSR